MLTVYDKSQRSIQFFKDHLENAVHGFEYLATNCTEVTQLGPYDDDHDHDHEDHHDNLDDKDNEATSRHRHSLTRDKRSPDHLSSLQDSVYLDDYDDDDHHDDVDDKDDDANLTSSTQFDSR